MSEEVLSDSCHPSLPQYHCLDTADQAQYQAVLAVVAWGQVASGTSVSRDNTGAQGGTSHLLAPPLPQYCAQVVTRYLLARIQS